jgi:hypothetical protein
MNLRTFNNYEYIEFNITDTNPIISINDNIIHITNLLSNTTCQDIITKSNKYYHSMELEYEPHVRDYSRYLNINDTLSNCVYSKIYKVLYTLPEAIPCGFGTKGKWVPIGLNNCFRHSYYEAPSIGFTYHRDSTYVKDLTTRSIYTIIIYLNNDFEGGETQFVKPHSDRLIGQTVNKELENGYDIICSIKPITGSAVIFNHNTIHAGMTVMSGNKHIIRSDIVYKNVEYIDDDWRNNKYYLESIELFREAGNQEMLGNVKLAGELYDKSLALRQFH